MLFLCLRGAYNIMKESVLNRFISGEIREEMNQILFWSKKKVTASFGVVEYREGDSLDSVISRADDYMYEAKSAGRDCIRGEK